MAVAYRTKYPTPYGGRVVAVGQYIGTYSIAAGALVLAEKRVYYVPISIPYPLRVTELSVYVTTTEAGKTAYLGIYSIERGVITKHIYSGLISLAVASEVILSANLTLSAGVYALVCYAESTTAAVRVVSVDTPLLPYSVATGTAQYTHYYEDKASFGDNLVDSPTVTLAVGDAPHLFAKVA